MVWVFKALKFPGSRRTRSGLDLVTCPSPQHSLNILGACGCYVDIDVMGGFSLSSETIYLPPDMEEKGAYSAIKAASTVLLRWSVLEQF